MKLLIIEDERSLLTGSISSRRNSCARQPAPMKKASGK